MKVYPFQALLPKDNAEAQKISELPYDVFSHTEVKQKLENNNKSILSVTRPDGLFDAPESVSSQEMYKKAGEKLQELQKTSIVQEEKSCFYIYQIEWQGSSQTGLVCLSDIKEYENSRIKKHEHTRPDKEQDRVDHMESIQSQTGNVLLVHRQNQALTQLFEKCKQEKESLFTCEKERGIVHKVWRIEKASVSEEVAAIFEKEIECTYIADGHHRVAAAYRLYQKDATNHMFLTTIFADAETRILPYNRLVKDVKNRSKEELLELIKKEFDIKLTPSPSEEEMAVFIGGSWFELKEREPNAQKVEDSLQASILQRKILHPIFDIKDPKKDKHIQFVGGIHGRKVLEERVLDNSFCAGFSLRAVSTDELLDVADAGGMMPPKSTWFEPKLLDGLFIYQF